MRRSCTSTSVRGAPRRRRKQSCRGCTDALARSARAPRRSGGRASAALARSQSALSRGSSTPRGAEQPGDLVPCVARARARAASGDRLAQVNRQPDRARARGDGAASSAVGHGPRQSARAPRRRPRGRARARPRRRGPRSGRESPDPSVRACADRRRRASRAGTARSRPSRPRSRPRPRPASRAEISRLSCPRTVPWHEWRNSTAIGRPSSARRRAARRARGRSAASATRRLRPICASVSRPAELRRLAALARPRPPRTRMPAKAAEPRERARAFPRAVRRRPCPVPEWVWVQATRTASTRDACIAGRSGRGGRSRSLGSHQAQVRGDDEDQSSDAHRRRGRALGRSSRSATPAAVPTRAP